MTFVKAFLLGWFGLVLLMWVSVQEQRAAAECMSAGFKWRHSEFPELVGTCVPGRSSARIYLPPLQVDPPMPTLVDPEPMPVPAL